MSYFHQFSRAIRRKIIPSKEGAFGPFLVSTTTAIDAMIQDDTAFFHRIPTRTIRMRFASHAEIKRIFGNRTLPEGMSWFALSHRVTPNIQWRRFTIAPTETDYYLSEADARAKWKSVCPPSYDAEHAKAVIRGMTVGGKCLCCRLHVGESEGAYPNIEAATAALDSFAFAIGIARPLIIGATDGIGAVWPFQDVTPTGEVLYLEAMKTLASRLQLRTDNLVLTDMSHLLRGMP